MPFLCHGNSGYTNTPQCYMCTLPVLFEHKDIHDVYIACPVWTQGYSSLMSLLSKVSELTLLFGNNGKVIWGCLSEKTEFLHDALILHHHNVHAHGFCPKFGNRMWSSTIFGTETWLFQKLKTALMSNRFSDTVNIQIMWQPSWRAFQSRDSKMPAIFL